jgi:predicted O-methyltransferase YrrM
MLVKAHNFAAAKKLQRARPAMVGELGCGASTFVAARALQLFGGGKIVSFDQHADFALTTQSWIRENNMDVEIRHAPLGTPPAGWPGHWYQLSDVPSDIDLLIVDGPPWAIHPHVRGAASSLFPLIRPGGRVLLDDAARPGERVVTRRWRKEHRNMQFILDTRGAKGTLLGHKYPA